jgi:hypothetical protein
MGCVNGPNGAVLRGTTRRVVSFKISPDVYHLANIHVSFYYLYLLSPYPFDGVLRTEGILLHPFPTTTELVLTSTLGPARACKRGARCIAKGRAASSISGTITQTHMFPRQRKNYLLALCSGSE